MLLSPVLLISKHLHEVFLIARLGLLGSSLRVDSPEVFDRHDLVFKVSPVKLLRLTHGLLLGELGRLLPLVLHLLGLV